MILDQKFAREVTVARGTLGLVSRIILIRQNSSNMMWFIIYKIREWKLVDLIFNSLQMISTLKFARRVAMVWGRLGLVSGIIPISAEICWTESELFIDRGQKLVDLIFKFLQMISAQKFPRRGIVAWVTVSLENHSSFGQNSSNRRWFIIIHGIGV